MAGLGWVCKGAGEHLGHHAGRRVQDVLVGRALARGVDGFADGSPDGPGLRAHAVFPHLLRSG